MNRRHFITKGSLAMLAAAGLPKAVFSNPNSVPTTYKTKLQPGVADQTYYELTIDHMCIDYLSSSTPEQKLIVLKVAYFDTIDLTKPAKGAEFNYIAKECTLITREDNIWQIKTKLDKKVTGDYKLPKGFPKHITLIGKKYAYFNIVDKKGETIINIPYPTTPSSGTGSGCFLTTACVEQKKLADNCEALTTLRFLRDDYMKNNASCASLIDNYKIVGPQIVNAINQCTNKAEIYEYMYQHMILPSVELVNKKQYAAATAYYKLFVKELMQQYL